MGRRILLALDSLQYGGAERHVADLARALEGRGYRVAIACSAPGPLRRDLSGIPVHVLSDGLVKRRVDREYAARLGCCLEAGGFDLVHAHSFAAAAAVALSGSDIPFVLTDHSHGTWRDEHDAAIYRQVCERAAAVIAVSDGIAERLRALGVDPDRVHRIHNAVPVQSGVLRLLRPTIGVIARLEPEKGVDVFLRAAALVMEREGEVLDRARRVGGVSSGDVTWGVGRGRVDRRAEMQYLASSLSRTGSSGNEGGGALLRGPALRPCEMTAAELGMGDGRRPSPCEFLVVGEGSQMDALQGVARSLGLDGRVRFLGGKVDGRALLPYLSILAVPSRSEGEPLVVLEGMSAGLPIVASAVGGIPHQIRDGRDGLLVPPDDPAELGSALLALLSESGFALWLGAAARRRAGLVFPFAEMVEAVEGIYRGAIGVATSTCPVSRFQPSSARQAATTMLASMTYTLTALSAIGRARPRCQAWVVRPQCAPSRMVKEAWQIQLQPGGPPPRPRAEFLPCAPAGGRSESSGGSSPDRD